MALPWTAPILLALVFGVTDADVVRGAAQRVLADPAYQRSLPGHRAPPRTARGNDGNDIDDDGGPALSSDADGTGQRRAFRGREGLGEGDGAGPQRMRRARSGSGRSSGGASRGVDARGFVEFLAIAGGLVIVALLVAALLRRRGVRPARSPRPQAAAAPAPTDVLAAPLDAADRLAAEGRFAEAIHLLLLRSLDALAKGQGLDPALTSREVVAQVAMPVTARSALGELVDRVEQSLFGGHAVDEAGWRRCRAQHDVLRAALAMGPGS